MAKQTERLSPLQVKNLKQPGNFADGDGLYLVVGSGSAKSWLHTYRDGDRRPQLGLGSFPAVSLWAARQKADEYRELKALVIPSPTSAKHRPRSAGSRCP